MKNNYDGAFNKKITLLKKRLNSSADHDQFSMGRWVIRVDKQLDANPIKEDKEGEEAQTPLPGRRQHSKSSVRSTPLVLKESATELQNGSTASFGTGRKLDIKQNDSEQNIGRIGSQFKLTQKQREKGNTQEDLSHLLNDQPASTGLHSAINSQKKPFWG